MDTSGKPACNRLGVDVGTIGLLFALGGAGNTIIIWIKNIHPFVQFLIQLREMMHAYNWTLFMNPPLAHMNSILINKE